MKISLSISLLLLLLSSCSYIANNESANNEEVTVTREGCCGIYVNKSTKSDVIELFGDNYELIENVDWCYKMKYKSLGLSFYYPFKPNQYFKSGGIFSIRLQSPLKAKTPEGIILGKSTLFDVIEKYGPGEWTTSDPYKYWDISYNGLIFIIKNNSPGKFPVDKTSHLKNKITELEIQDPEFSWKLNFGSIE